MISLPPVFCGGANETASWPLSGDTRATERGRLGGVATWPSVTRVEGAEAGPRPLALAAATCTAEHGSAAVRVCGQENLCNERPPPLCSDFPPVTTCLHGVVAWQEGG